MPKNILTTLLSLGVCSGSLTLALDKPVTPQPVSDTGGHASRPIAAETAASITALGTDPTPKQISAIVFKAVRSSPDNVLPIVDAAVRVSPQTVAPEIVAAATSAVPNPWRQVIYRRIRAQDANESEPDYKSGPDGKQARDGGRSMDLGGRNVGEAGANFADGSQMTLAEAIVRTAFDAQPSLSFSALQSAVNAALLTDPAILMRYIQSPIVVSGVGDAGLSNYANEPLRSPRQPVISR